MINKRVVTDVIGVFLLSRTPSYEFIKFIGPLVLKSITRLLGSIITVTPRE